MESMLIDTHCHLNWPDYQDDFSEILARAQTVGIRSIVTIGTDVASLASSKILVTRFDDVYRTIGFHPDCVLEEGFSLETINSYMKLLTTEVEYPKTVGIGECGLDYYCFDDKGFSPDKISALKDLQIELFERQILFAIQHDLPLSLHVRDSGTEAYEDVVAILEEYYSARSGFDAHEFSFSYSELKNTFNDGKVISDKATPATPIEDERVHGVLHCVSGSPEYVDACVDLGFYVSFAGNVTYKNAQNIVDHAKRVPLDKIVVETDGPFLSPVPHRGKRNEPAYLVETVQKIAEARGVSVEEISQATTENAQRLFGL